MNESIKERAIEEQEEIALLDSEINKVLDEREESEIIPYNNPNYGLMEFFKELLGFKTVDDVFKIAKTGNLREPELGSNPLSVRKYLSIAQYADTEGLTEVGDYMREEAINTLSTSLSRKGSLINAVITNKKVNRNLGPVTREVETGMFGKKKELVIGEDQEGSL